MIALDKVPHGFLSGARPPLALGRFVQSIYFLSETGSGVRIPSKLFWTFLEYG